MENSAETQVRTGNKILPDCEGCDWQGDDVYPESTAGDKYLCTACRLDWFRYLVDVNAQVA